MKLDTYDHYLADNGPAALVIRELLIPVEGEGGVFFPATYAGPKEKNSDFDGGYNIDRFKDGRNICLVDSIASQANRIEVIFNEEKFENYHNLVPQLRVLAGADSINIVEAGHRGGDALFRCSDFHADLQNAFLAANKGDSIPLAKIAPTSLVFGAWDSRDTQVKVPRLITSCIRAFDVQPLHRSAVYNPPVDYSKLDVFSKEEMEKASGDSKNPLSKRGFVNALASWSHGGVIADGGVRRDATLSLSALRQTCRTSDKKEQLKLQRYIFSLALTAFTYSSCGYLRQGCNLVLNPDQPREFKEVHGNGERKDAQLTHEDALKFAQAAAKDFGIGESKTVPFDKKLAKSDVKKKEK